MLKKILLQSKIRTTVLIAIIATLSYFGYQNFINTKSSQPQYQTAETKKGSLTTSVTVSGIVSQASGATITTQSTGIVKNVYVKNGDLVTMGQQIADLTLDIASQQKLAAAWASYLVAKNSLATAQNTLNSLNSAMWQTQQDLINDAVARGLSVDDPTYIQQSSDWLKAENDYKNQQNVITASQASLGSAWLSYSQLAPIITAPMTGKISGLTIAPGMTIPTTLGTITIAGGMPQATVNLTEIDVVKIKAGQKVVLTLDALPDKTFTGIVVTVNTNGAVSSNVTTYPTTITFDTATKTIYPNMAVNATIIIDVKNNVILVPSSTVQTANGKSTVRIIRENQVITTPVEIGGSNDTQTEIVSGVNAADMVVTGQTTPTATNGSIGTSPFGNTRGGFGDAAIQRR